MKININGKQFEAKEGQTVLEVAREHNVYIPTLCDAEGVAPYGACRLCLVEATTARGRKRLVTSCLYPVEEGLSVLTSNEKIDGIRKMLIELLAARCPDSEVIQDMRVKLGVAKVRFTLQQDKNKCILCGLCTRVCKEVVGVAAISLANRGVEREVTTPFDEDFSPSCIGCGSCAYVCPTGAIVMEDAGDTRTIKWPHNKMEFKRKRCKVCGAYWVPEKQLEHIAKKSNTPIEDYDVCPDCRS